VRSDNGEKVVLFQKRTSGWIREEVGTTTDTVMNEEIAGLFLAKFFERVGPKDIAHEPMGRGFTEAIDLYVGKFSANANPDSRYVQL
jgi:hypothetical protein